MQVNHPKYGILNFPDNMSQEAIRQALIKLDQQGNKIIQPAKQQPVQQQPVAPKPVVKEEEKNLFEIGIDKVANFFKGDEEPVKTPQQKVSNQIPVTVNPNLKKSTGQIPYNAKNVNIPEKTSTETNASELANQGYKQNLTFQQQLSALEDKYNNESQKIINKYKTILSLAGGENLDLNQLPVNLKTKYQQEINQVNIKKQSELNKLKAQPNNNKFGVVNDINQKNKLVQESESSINSFQKEIETLSKQNEFVNLLKNDFNAGPQGMNPLGGAWDLFQTYLERKNKINEKKKTLEEGKKNLDYLKKYNIDIIEAAKEIPGNDLPQLASAYDKSIKGLIQSAKKLIGREDETDYLDLNKGINTNNLIGGTIKLAKGILLNRLGLDVEAGKDVTEGVKDLFSLGDKVKIKNLASDNNTKNAWEKTENVFSRNIEFRNASYKNDLQEKIASKGWQNDISVYDNRFNSLAENYNDLKNDPNKLFGFLRTLYNKPEDQEKVLFLLQDPSFQNIVSNNNLLGKINGDRIGQNLKMFTKDKIESLEALKVVKNLNERQQIQEDILEQQSDKSGLISPEKAKFLLYQMYKGGKYGSEYGKQMVGTLGTTISPESENMRKLEYRADLWKGINFAQDEGNISLFDKGVKWVNIPVDKNNNYQVSYDEFNNVIDIRANDMSLPVKGTQRQVLENHFYSNLDKYKKEGKSITEMPGGFKVALGGLSKAIGVGLVEEGPSLAGEALLTAVTEGAASPLLEANLARIGVKLANAKKITKNFNKVAGQAINFTSSYAETAHDIKKDYEDRGLDPGLYEVVNTAGLVSGVSQISSSLEDKYRKLGSNLVADVAKRESRAVLMEDVPKIVKTISDELVDIKDKKLKEYLFNKELRDFTIARYSDRVANAIGSFKDEGLKIAQAFKKEGLQEAGEEVILEPMAQVLANYANAALTGNEEYNKETLQDLGFLDPETALIAGLTGGIMSSSMELGPKILNSTFNKNNGLNSIDALNAAINDPNKFKSLLSTFINVPDASGNSLTQEKYNDIVKSFDTIKNNYETTKKDYNLDENFISKIDFNNPLHNSILENVGINANNIEGFNGSKTLDNIILNSELNKVNKEKVTNDLAESLGIPNKNNQLDLTPYLNENGFFDYNKYNQIVGKDTIDEVTQKNIQDYNQIIAKERGISNLLNLFNKNLGSLQDQYKSEYQDTIETNSELLNPQARFINSIYQENLFNKLVNESRINKINSMLEIGQGLTKDKQLREELLSLNESNKDITNILNNIKDTYKNGYFEAQGVINNLDEELSVLDNELKNKLNDYMSPSTIDSLSEDKEKEINDLITAKSNKLKELKKAHKEFNKTFNNNIKSSELNKNVVENDDTGKPVIKNITVEKNLEDSIKKDKETLKNIKDYRKVFNKIQQGKVTQEDLNKLKSNNRLYNKELLQETVLPYYVSFNKEELNQAFNNDPDLLLGMFSILEEMGYIPEIVNYKDINLDTLNSLVTDGIIKLNYNISLINANKKEEIKNIDQENSALLINSYINTITEESSKDSKKTAPKTPTLPSSQAQDNTIALIEKNSKLKTEFNDSDITSTSYFIDGKEYKRVTTLEKAPLQDSKYLTAGANVGNFFDSLGRVIFGNLDVTVDNIDTILLAQMQTFADQGIELNLNKDSYITIFKKLIEQRDALVKQGFKFITEERVVYHAYDGTNFIGENPIGIDDNTIGIAGTMDIIAIDKNGKIDIIDLKTISDNKGKANENLKEKETNGWAQQLTIYKTLLEKIPSVKVNNVKVFSAKVIYNIEGLGNNISNLNFKGTSFKSILASKPILNLINKYLLIPNLVVETPSEKIITDFPVIEDSIEEMPDYILEQQQLLAEESGEEDLSNVDMGPSLLDLDIQENFEPEEIGPSEFDLNPDYQPINTSISSEEADNIFGTPTTQTEIEAKKIEIDKLISDKNEELRGLSSNMENAEEKIDKVNNKYNKLITKARKELSILQKESPIQKTKLANELVEGDQIIIDNKLVTVVRITPTGYTNGIQSWIEGNEIFKIQIEGEGITSGIFGNDEIYNPSESKDSSELINWEVDLFNDLENETPTEFEVEPTQEENTRAKSVFGSKPKLNSETQLITGQANTENFEENNNIDLGGFTDEDNSNIVSLNKVSYIKFNISYDVNNNEQYMISIFNNSTLNKKFNKLLNKEEVLKLFKENGLFFTDKIEPNKVYVLKYINKEPVPSFQQTEIINKVDYAESDILNSINADNLNNQDAEIVLLDTKDNYNESLKTEEDFRNNASLGLVINNTLVSLIPTNKGNTKNAQVRNNLIITKENGKFKIQPFKVKIKKVKKGALLFNNNPMKINSFLNVINGFKSTVAFVSQQDKNKKLINPFVSKEKSQLNIPADNLTNNGVYLILEKGINPPIIIPLKTPTLKEFFNGSNEELQMIKAIFNETLSDNFNSQDLKTNYNTFIERLKNASDKNSTINQIYSVIPKSINETSSNVSQKLKLENLKLNFNLANITDYLWDTLVNLNESTKEFYSVDLDPQNFYADNSVVIDYEKDNIIDTKNNDTVSKTVFNEDNDAFC